jgi:hypothetical protein
VRSAGRRSDSITCDDYIMIIVDFSQIAYSCILEHLASTKLVVADIDMVRHVILNSLRSNVKKFKREYGEVVIAMDDRNYWRREYFAHYKANRKKNRDKSPFNWTSIFTCLDTLKAELQANLMYKIVSVEGCEADDIIGVLAHTYAPSQKIMIVSGDKDFNQLQVYANVYQYSPLLKKMIVEQFPTAALKQHIIRGDSGDGVPNILSPDDVFVTGGRQKPIMEKKIITWLNMEAEAFCTADMLRNFKRNEMLIDLKQIPEAVKTKIAVAYESSAAHGRNHFWKYLIASGLRELTATVEDF